MEKNLIIKRIIWIVVLLIIELVSIFPVSKVTTSQEFHTKSIQSLDEKKMTVMELTAATAGAATALALIPSDATTPLANQIARLSSYLLIVIGAIFLEKILLTLTGYITFTFLIPIACLLFAIYLFIKKDVLKNLAIKLTLFGIVIFLVVPVSVQVSNLIEDTYQNSINETIENAKNTNIDIETNKDEKTKENKNWWESVVSNVTEGISNIGDTVSGWLNKGKQMLSNFIDAIAVLLITSCVIPIIVLIFFMWIIKIIFGISIPNIKNTKLNKDMKKQQTDNSKEVSTTNPEKTLNND